MPRYPSQFAYSPPLNPRFTGAKPENRQILAAVKKFDLVDCLIVHRYGRLDVNDKIVLVVCFSEHRNNSFEACKFIMDYLKRDVPFWKKEIYFKGSDWLENTN